MGWGEDNNHSDYELREARSEIRRHHELIRDMREALDWSISMIENNITTMEVTPFDLQVLTIHKLLLNRQVS